MRWRRVIGRKSQSRLSTVHGGLQVFLFVAYPQCFSKRLFCYDISMCRERATTDWFRKHGAFANSASLKTIATVKKERIIDADSDRTQRRYDHSKSLFVFPNAHRWPRNNWQWKSGRFSYAEMKLSDRPIKLYVAFCALHFIVEYVQICKSPDGSSKEADGSESGP